MREAGQDIISLALGETDDFDTPLHIKAAAIEAIDSGKTKYTPVDGIAKLKQAICQKLLQENDLEYNPYEVIVSTGAKQSIHNAMMCLLDKGDEVILTAPYWPSYYDNIVLTGAKPVIIKTSLEKKFKLLPEQLEAAITKNTRIVIINSPNNPSGQIYSASELKKLSKILLKHPQILIITDDIYEHIKWSETEFSNILNVCPSLKERTLIINGISKSFAMTGWRMGYAAGPIDLIQKMKSFQSQATSCPCSITQYAALEALDGNLSTIDKMVQTFQKRHNFMFEFLTNLEGCEVQPAQGAYYLFPKVTEIIKRLELKSDLELVDLILEKAGVSVLPGSVFGVEGHLRISFVSSDDRLKEAIKRINEVIHPTESTEDNETTS